MQFGAEREVGGVEVGEGDVERVGGGGGMGERSIASEVG